MNSVLFAVVILCFIYIANVLCCAVICEAENEMGQIRRFIFLVPLVNVLMFFYFLLFKQHKAHSHLQYAFAFLRIPAKNYLVIMVLAQSLAEYNRRVVTKSVQPVLTPPRILAFANLYKKQVSYVQSIR